MTRHPGRSGSPTEFEVWGCRGSRSFVPLRFQEASHVLRSLEQEARSLEMELGDYLKALLADRHRALYGSQQAPLWYPRVQPVAVEQVRTRERRLMEFMRGPEFSLEKLKGRFSE